MINHLVSLLILCFFVLFIQVNTKKIKLEETSLAYQDIICVLYEKQDSLISLSESLMDENYTLQVKVNVLSQGRPVYFTAYNALKEQTDNTPTITASGATIYEGSCALPRNYLTRYKSNAMFSYGDTVLFIIPFIVEDTLNKRYTRTCDIYMEDLQMAKQFGRREGLLVNYERKDNY